MWFECGNRYLSCIHTQLRLGVNTLNHSLFVRQLITSETCPSCQTENETVRHFLLFCPCYDVHRMHLILCLTNLLHNESLYQMSDDAVLKLLLYGNERYSTSLNVKIFLLIQDYIKSTKRFK